MNQQHVIEVKNLFFRYSHGSADWVLKDISTYFDAGQFTVILGANGSGKSTLARQLNALLLPASGSVWIDGLDSRKKENQLAIKQKVGLVFQNPDNQLVSTIVAEDTAFAPENLGLLPEEIQKRVFDALKAVDMYDYREQSTFKLSGGQKQRLAIAGMLTMQPKVLVLDESTSMLDPQGRHLTMQLLGDLKKQGMSIILITHHLDEVPLADRVILMSQGQIAAQGSPAAVFSQKMLLKNNHLQLPESWQLLACLRRAGLSDLPIASSLPDHLDWQKTVAVIEKALRKEDQHESD